MSFAARAAFPFHMSLQIAILGLPISKAARLRPFRLPRRSRRERSRTMSRRSRLLAAVLLAAALAVPASLQASGLPSPRTAAHDGGSLLRASPWSPDGLLRMIHQLWLDAGGGLDPN